MEIRRAVVGGMMMLALCATAFAQPYAITGSDSACNAAHPGAVRADQYAGIRSGSSNQCVALRVTRAECERLPGAVFHPDRGHGTTACTFARRSGGDGVAMPAQPGGERPSRPYAPAPPRPPPVMPGDNPFAGTARPGEIPGENPFRQARQQGSVCQRYFADMRAAFRERAAICARETHLIGSLTPLLRGDGTFMEAAANGRVTRRSAPDLFAVLRPNDPRWISNGELAAPVCSEPLSVRSQNDAFLECARVYLCGSIAARCGLERSAGVDDPGRCPVISGECLQMNPVPQ